jgi:RimJ/RimL family protein N-acetyltransferase
VQLPSTPQLGSKFRLLKIEDAQEILDWRNIPEIYKFTTSGAPVSSANHSKWMDVRLGKLSDEPIYILEKDFKLGMFRVDKVLDKPMAFEISILVSPKYLGSGIGSQMMELYFGEFVNHLSGEYLARIHKDNIRSQNFFRKHCFVRVAEEDNFLVFRRDGADD